MSDQDPVLAAYNRAIARERTRSGINWPHVRPSCIYDDGTITTTDRLSPEVVATWRIDAIGRVRIILK